MQSPEAPLRGFSTDVSSRGIHAWGTSAQSSVPLRRSCPLTCADLYTDFCMFHCAYTWHGLVTDTGLRTLDQPTFTYPPLRGTLQEIVSPHLRRSLHGVLHDFTVPTPGTVSVTRIRVSTHSTNLRLRILRYVGMIYCGAGLRCLLGGRPALAGRPRAVRLGVDHPFGGVPRRAARHPRCSLSPSPSGLPTSPWWSPQHSF